MSGASVHQTYTMRPWFRLSSDNIMQFFISLSNVSAYMCIESHACVFYKGKVPFLLDDD